MRMKSPRPTLVWMAMVAACHFTLNTVCVVERELCDTEAVSWVVEGLALSHRHTAGSHRE